MSAGHLSTSPGRTIVPLPLKVAREFFFILSLRPVVCPSVCFKGQTCVQDTLKVACSLPEGFDVIAMSAGPCLSGMPAKKRARRSASPSFTTLTPRSMTYYSVPIGRPTTVTPPPTAMRMSTICRSEISSAAAARPFWGRTAVLAGLATIASEEGNSSSRVDDLHKADKYVYTSSTPSLQLLLSLTPRGSASAPAAKQGRTPPPP